MPFLNLAPFLFRDIAKGNGPIDKLDLFEFVDSRGRTQFEAHAYLKPGLRNTQIASSQIYGSCDGTGTGSSKIEAVRKSISEAMERWAFYTLVSQDSNQFGLDIDDTSTGFAALPCWPKKAARTPALREAVERWAITNWWNGNLQAREFTTHSNFEGWEIQIPFDKIKVTILSKAVKGDAEALFYVYGFASSSSIEKSTSKALIEMDRNYGALMKAYKSGLDIKSVQDISDKRLIYFSSQEGRLSFENKISHKSTLINTHPKLVVDSEIPGPWSQYATVWRCLLENTDTNLQDVDFFLF